MRPVRFCTVCWITGVRNDDKENRQRGRIMKKDIKEQLIQLLGTLQEAHQEIQGGLEKKEYGTVQNLLADCQESAVFIGNTIEQFERNQEEIIGILEEYCERLFGISGEDPFYEERMKDVRSAFGNLDGTIGRNVYRCLKESLI